MKIRFTGLLLASLFLLSACGQKGPLYLEKTPVSEDSASKVEKDTATKETESAEKEVKPENKD